MAYLRKKARGNKTRTISGYTRSDGTRVAPYSRRKRRDIRKYRNVNN